MNHIKLIPTFQRKKSIPKQLKDLELTPLNEQFSKLTMPIISDDDFRPAMMGNFFDMESKKIVSTDAHKLTAINMPKDTYNFIAQKYNKELNENPKGLIFHTLSQLQKDYNSMVKNQGNNPITISFDEFVKLNEIEDSKYPNYDAVIPKEFTNEIYVDFTKLWWYSKVLLDAKIIDDATKINSSNDNEYQNKKIEYLKDSYVPFLSSAKQIIFTYTLDGKKEFIGFDARYICDILKFAIEYKYKTFGKVGLSGNNRAMVIEFENGLYSPSDSIGLIMPVMLNSGTYSGTTIGQVDYDFNVKMYYDLDKNEINSDGVNYPIDETIGFKGNKESLSIPKIRVEEKVTTEVTTDNSYIDDINIDNKILIVEEKGKPLSTYKNGDKVFWANYDKNWKQYVEGEVFVKDNEYSIKRFPQNPNFKKYPLATFNSNTKVVLKPNNEPNYSDKTIKNNGVKNTQNDSMTFITNRIKGLKIALKVARAENKPKIQKRILGLEIAKKMQPSKMNNVVDKVFEWKKQVTSNIDTKAEAEKSKKSLQDYYGQSGRNFQIEKIGGSYRISYEFSLTDKMQPIEKTNNTIKYEDLLEQDRDLQSQIDEEKRKPKNEQSELKRLALEREVILRKIDEMEQFNNGGGVVSKENSIKEFFKKFGFNVEDIQKDEYSNGIEGWIVFYDNKNKYRVIDYSVAMYLIVHDKTTNKTDIIKQSKSFNIDNFNNGGGVESSLDYKIIEGYDHYNNYPLYQVVGKDNDYIGEYHTDIKDAKKELKEFENEKFNNGGGVTDLGYNYKSVEEIWDNWTTKQKEHFLYDHQHEYPEIRNISKLANLEWNDLKINYVHVLNSLSNHIREGRYNKGGVVFTNYNGSEIMYEPNYDEYFVNDEVFYSMEDAKNYIDTGEMENEKYGFGGGLLVGSLVGGYLGYKVGKYNKQTFSSGFDTEKRIGKDIKNKLQGKKFVGGGGIDELTNGQKNQMYLDDLSMILKRDILQNISKSYGGISIAKVQSEIYDDDAEMLYEYITNNDDLRKKVYLGIKSMKRYDNGGGVDTISDEDLLRIKLAVAEAQDRIKANDKESESGGSASDITNFIKENPQLLMLLEKGGSVGDENYEMLKNKVTELLHHSKELQAVVKKKPKTPAWVISKSSRASTDLSDITHYLEGKL